MSDRTTTSTSAQAQTPAVYTKAGLDWIDHNSMRTVLARHYPTLKGPMKGLKNGFHPWSSTAG